MRSRESDRIALWSPVAIGLGIYTFFSLKFEPAQAWGWIAGGAALGLLLLRIGRGGAAMWPTLRVTLASIALVALGFAVASMRTWSVAAPVWAERSGAVIEGRVLAVEARHSQRSGDDAEAKPSRWRMTLDRLSIDGVPAGETPARVRVTGPAPTASPKDWLRARVRLTATLSPPPGPAEPQSFDFRQRAWFERLGAVGYAKDPPTKIAQPAPRSFSERIDLLIQQARAWIADRALTAAPGAEGAVMAALLVGDRSSIPPDVVDALRDTNLAHLLAISGLHMGIVCFSFFVAVRAVAALTPAAAASVDPKKIAAVVALLAGAGYLALSGAAISTQRAFVMAAIAFFAVLVDRPAITLRAVAAAATLILLWRPESLFAPGFQLSFAATTAMVAAFEVLRDGARSRRRRRRSSPDANNEPATAAPIRWAGSTPSRVFVAGVSHLLSSLPRSPLARGLATLALCTVVAGLATAPFAAFTFNRLSQYGFIANIAATPAMGAWIMPCGAAALLLAPFGAEGVPLDAMALGVKYILAIADTVAGWSDTAVLAPTGSSMAIGLIAVGGLFVCLWRSPSLRLVGALVIVLGLSLWSAPSRPNLLIGPHGALLGVETPIGRALDRASGRTFVADTWLRRDGDPATQAEAAARVGFFRQSGRAVAVTPEGWRVVLSLRRSLPEKRLEALCRPMTIIVAPRASAQRSSAAGFPQAASDMSSTSCLLFDRPRLAELAPIAIHWSQTTYRAATGEFYPAVDVVPLPAVVGRRLWTDANTRARLGK